MQTGGMMRVAVVFSRFGPYHVARLEAAGERLAGSAEVIGVEVARTDRFYGWDVVDRPLCVGRETLFPSQAYNDLAPRAIRAGVQAALDRLSPAAVALPGWSYPEAAGGLAWCRRCGVPAVLLSESARADAKRRMWREVLKRLIVRRFAAAVVGGAPHADYVCELGMPREKVFTGYDVVDNAYFAAGADAARGRVREERMRLGLPDRYFMASSRFLPKKNLGRLVEAYANYRSRSGAGAWGLVICGSGPGEDALRQQIGGLGVEADVMLPGFVQYTDLPAYYGLASAFVHASTTEQWGLVVNEAMAAGLAVIVSDRCGCASDLVTHGVNGYTFDPERSDALAEAMCRVAAGGARVDAMGAESRRIIAEWGPERFGNAMRQALEVCRQRGNG